MKFVALALSLLFLILIGFFNLIDWDWLFFIGIVIILILGKLLTFSKLGQKHRIIVLIIALILLNFIPYPRKLQKSGYGGYFNNTVLGIGFPAAFIKYRPACDKFIINPDNIEVMKQPKEICFFKPINTIMIDLLVFIAFFPIVLTLARKKK